ncbi:MAG: hypothetical protein QXY99_07685 [Thermoproteota archaeon]
MSSVESLKAETFFPSTKVMDFFTVASAAIVAVLSTVNIIFLFLMVFPLIFLVLGKLSRKLVKYTVDLGKGVFVINSLGKEEYVLLDKIVAVESIRLATLKFLNVGKVKVLTEDGTVFSTSYVDDFGRLSELLSFKKV